MTVEVQVPFNAYVAAPGATVFTYEFKIVSPADLICTIDGGTPLELGVDYSLSGVGSNDGGDLTLFVPLVGAEIVLLKLQMTFNRLTDYQQNGDFNAVIVNNDFDRIWLALQQLGQDLLRSIKVPFTETTDQTIPISPAARANKALVFDASGNVTASADNYNDQAADAAASAAAAAASEEAVNLAAAEVEADRLAADASAVAAAASAASINPSNLMHLTGNETAAGIKTFSSAPVVPADFCWMTKAIGEPFPLRDDLAGVAIPPTNNAAYRYIKLTAADGYNTGVLTGESVSGSAPDVIATAVISLAGSSINGLTVNLLNTERRFIRAGSSGTVEVDTFRAHTHGFTGSVPLTNIGGASSDAPVANNRGTTGATNSTGGTETRPKNQGATYYMRIK